MLRSSNAQRHRVLSPEYPRAQGVCDITSKPKVTWFRRGLPWLDNRLHGQVGADGWLNYLLALSSLLPGGGFRVSFAPWCASKVTRRFHSNWDPVFITNAILPNCQRIANVPLNRMTLSSFRLRSSSFFCSGVRWGPKGSQGRSMLTMESMHAAGCLSPRPSIMFPQ